MNRTSTFTYAVSGFAAAVLGVFAAFFLWSTLAQAQTEEPAEVVSAEEDVVAEVKLIADTELKRLYDALPARRTSVRSAESAFVAEVTKNGPPTAILSTVEQEQLMQHVNSATLKMQSLLDGVLATASEAERLAYRISNERNVVMDEILVQVGDVRLLVSETRGDIVAFSNLAGLMLLSDDPLTLSTDVQESAKIVHDQLLASRDMLIKITTVLMQNSVVSAQ